MDCEVMIGSMRKDRRLATEIRRNVYKCSGMTSLAHPRGHSPRLAAGVRLVHPQDPLPATFSSPLILLKTGLENSKDGEIGGIVACLRRDFELLAGQVAGWDWAWA
jgi:hypothetical protein